MRLLQVLFNNLAAAKGAWCGTKVLYSMGDTVIIICFLLCTHNFLYFSGIAIIVRKYSLSQSCNFQSFFAEGCHTYSDTCSYSQNGDLRLSPDAYVSSTQGVVEMCNDDSGYGWEWGVIADTTTWTDNDARVVCRQLGLSTSG